MPAPSDDARAEADARAASFRVPRPRRGGPAITGIAVLTLAVWLLAWGSAVSTLVVDALPATLVALLAFLPYVAGVALGVLFVLWTLAPDHRGMPWFLAAALLVPLAWWGPTWARRPLATDGTPVRVMTWNVRRLWGVPEDEHDATACVVAAIEAADPDVVVLQEVTAADLGRLSDGAALTCTWGTYRTRDAATGSGIAVCARHGWALQGAPEPFVDGDDWRYVRAVVRHGDADLGVLGVHFQPFQLLDDPVGHLSRAVTRLPAIAAAHTAQGEALLARVDDSERPVVVAGDFNSTRDTPLHAVLRRHLVDAWEAGAVGMAGTVNVLGWLPMRIDFLYVTPNLGVADTSMPPAACSDHRPVVTDLRIPR
ncbi:MAG: endonuclease/exonuclease/phosphatase family protein [Alphaproteobacteria bacterium]|nr:endonuclease/exonuclease/phosphatase family protein [Alphaproteobacteria bacterium]